MPVRRSSAEWLADDVIAALRVDGTPPEASLVDTALVERVTRRHGKKRLSNKRYAAFLAPLLHKCLPGHPTGGNCPKHRATLFYLLRDVKPLNKNVLNRLRIILFPGIDYEGPRIDKELGLVKC